MHKRSLCCHEVSVCPSVTFVDHVKTTSSVTSAVRFVKCYVIVNIKSEYSEVGIVCDVPVSK